MTNYQIAMKPDTKFLIKQNNPLTCHPWGQIYAEETPFGRFKTMFFEGLGS